MVEAEYVWKPIFAGLDGCGGWELGLLAAGRLFGYTVEIVDGGSGSGNRLEDERRERCHNEILLIYVIHKVNNFCTVCSGLCDYTNSSKELL
ncbi:hypothetical protein T265_09692 [Opisthorchis viverrini]|uniref:Uncharacterized protein n=1 Tax=Opisthorchis viverrini TaxID=6198 RepID=A0A074Z4W8_OPIVI|nr:hypothetical protein T265_09692 [Opisthorchis viverrini]KER22126.1 hypothetical protein T265_09692 [Opisthorchis viverrini]